MTFISYQYCFPPQSQVISACAELARRIVTGESLDGDTRGDGKKNGRVDKFFKPQEKRKEKEVEAARTGRTLVVVG